MSHRPSPRLLAMLAAALLVASSLTAATPGRAVEPSRAAVLVMFGDGRSVLRTVAFTEASISGLDLLQRSGLDVLQADGLICRIASEGCAYPAQACLCAQPRYWTYWLWRGGAWAYSGGGAAATVVSDGALQAWTWGNAVAPPVLDPTLVFDVDRAAPGPPTLEAGATVPTLRLPVQGDANGNASAWLTYAAPLSLRVAPTLPMARQGDAFLATLWALPPGRWEVTVQVEDPDGVNGSAAWTLAVEIPGAHTLHVPLCLDGATPSGGQP
ncbi:MAG: hypothetical protein V1772_03610 [Chloroflexota bacterium]